MDKFNEEVKWKKWRIALVIISTLIGLFINTVVVTSYIKDVENKADTNEKSIIRHEESIKGLQDKSDRSYNTIKTMELNLKLFMKQQGYEYQE